MPGVFIFVFVFLLLGALRLDQFESVTGPAEFATNSGASAGVEFLAYRNAVVNYVESNKGFTGTVPDAELVFAPGVVASVVEANATNEVISDGSGGYDVYCWAPGSPGALQAIAAATGEDLSFGLTSGTEWETPAGGIMGPTPAGVPSGDLFSAAQIGT